MGKTKTAFISGAEEVKKTSAEIYAEKKAKKLAEIAKDKPEAVVEEIKKEETLPIEVEAVEEKQVKIEKEIVIKTRGKKYLDSKAKISKTTLYKTEDAIKLIKDTSYAKFDETFEIHMTVKKIGISEQVTLPFSTGKQKRVEIADDKTIEKLKTGKIDFDLLLSTTEMMPKLVMFAKLLGPKGLMPNPKNGTVIKSAKDAVKFQGNLITLKTEREQPLIHTSFGKVSQKTEELIKNAESILNALGGSKKILRAFVKSTMSPSVRIVI